MSGLSTRLLRGASLRSVLTLGCVGSILACQNNRDTTALGPRYSGSPKASAYFDCGAGTGGSLSDTSLDATRTDAQLPNLYDDGGRDASLELPDASLDADGAPRGFAKHAILISVDGLGAGYVNLLFNERRLPNMSALARWGSSTLHARTDFDYTETLPDHTSMITGRPVAPVPGLPDYINHGYVNNGMPSPEQTLHNAGNPNLAYVASTFDIVHDAGLKTCLYSLKPKFVIFPQSYSDTTGAPDTTGDDNGRSKIDRCAVGGPDTPSLIAMAASDMENGLCDFVFFHIADTDLMGHSLGWGTKEWLDIVDTVDTWVGTFAKFTALSQVEPWALVLTADHGGEDYTHIDPTLLEDYRIPFFVVGPGVTPNTDLYEFVGSRRKDPGLDRPDYTVSGQPIRNGDAANTILQLMGLPPVPGSLMRDLLP